MKKTIRCGAVLSSILSLGATGAAQTLNLHPESESYQRTTVASGIEFAGEYSSALCVDPNDPARLIAIVSEGEIHSSLQPGNRPRDHLTVYMSSDSGASWSPVRRTDDGSDYIDPACLWMRNGHIVVSAMNSQDVQPGYRGYQIARSSDMGNSWSSQRIQHPEVLDRGYLSEGATASGTAVYLNTSTMAFGAASQQRPAGLAIFASHDNGATFSIPTLIDAGLGPGAWVGARGIIHNGSSTTLNDGTLLVSWHNLYAIPTTSSNMGASDPLSTTAVRQDDERPGMAKVFVARSRDGGRTFERPVIVARGTWDLSAGRVSPPVEGRGKFIPSIASDSSDGPFRNNAYIVWADVMNGRKEIWFSSSADAGETWQRPVVISDRPAVEYLSDRTGPSDLQPSIAVSSSGVIGILYYSEVESDTYSAKLTLSYDGGVSWTSPASVDRPLQRQSRTQVIRRGNSDVEVRFSRTHMILSCSAPITADRYGNFHVLSVSTMPDGEGWSYIRITPTRSPTHATELTSEVTVRPSPVEFNASNGDYSTDVQIQNSGARPLRLPLMLQDLGQDALSRAFPGRGPIPGLGRRAIVGADASDNGRRYNGAVWLFGGNEDRDYLQPGEVTRVRHISYRTVNPSDAAALASSFGRTWRVLELDVEEN